MFFTKEDILKIQAELNKTGIKDSDFRDAKTPLDSEELLVLTQKGKNVKISLGNFINQLRNLSFDDFINVTYLYDAGYITLEEAIEILPKRTRKIGVVITFQNTQGYWEIYQFNDSDISNFKDPSYWQNLKIATAEGMTYSDEEDITTTTVGNKAVLKFKDRDDSHGMGHIILRRNRPFAEQVTEENTIYEIRYDFDLNGQEVIIPSNCVLKFEGGSLRNGIVRLNYTELLAHPNSFNNISLRGHSSDDTYYFDWFSPYKLSMKEYYDAPEVTDDTNDKIYNGIRAIWENSAATGIPEDTPGGSEKVGYFRLKIIFGDGIYPFKDKILVNWSNRLISKMEGINREKSILYFPNSIGFDVVASGLDEGEIRNLTIHSKYQCFYLRHSCTRMKNTLFENLNIISEEGDFAIGNEYPKNAMLYHNIFKNIRHMVKDDKAVFSGFSNLGTSFTDMTCIENHNHKNLKNNHIYYFIFDTCVNVKLYNCNYGDGLKGIYRYYSTSKNSMLNNKFYAQNCNFEAIGYRFFDVTGIYTILSLDFSSCSFIYNENYNKDENYECHFYIDRIGDLKGIPEVISVYKKDGTLVSEPTIIKTKTTTLNYSTILDQKARIQNVNILPLKQGNKNRKVRLNTTTGAVERSITGNDYSRYIKNLVVGSTYYEYNNIDLSISNRVSQGTENNDYFMPRVVVITNANIDNYSLLIDRNVGYLYNSNYNTVEFNDIIIINNTDYVVKVSNRTDNNGDKAYILPKNYIKISPRNYRQHRRESSYITTYHLYVNKGSYINNSICVDEGLCGVYITTKRVPNTNYTRLDFLHLQTSGVIQGFEYDGYNYVCIKTGVTSSEENPIYSKTLNDTITDGTAEFRCIGKAATLSAINYDGTLTSKVTVI